MIWLVENECRLSRHCEERSNPERRWMDNVMDCFVPRNDEKRHSPDCFVPGNVGMGFGGYCAN